MPYGRWPVWGRVTHGACRWLGASGAGAAMQLGACCSDLRGAGRGGGSRSGLAKTEQRGARVEIPRTTTKFVLLRCARCAGCYDTKVTNYAAALKRRAYAGGWWVPVAAHGAAG